MPKICFIVASSEDRIHFLNKCIEHISKTVYKNCDVYLYFQGDISKVKNVCFFKGIIHSPVLRGVFTPRYALMKKYCMDYDYTIIIDDDLYMYPDTSYDNAMAFLEKTPTAGCCCICMHFMKRRNEIKCISDTKEDYNIYGGMVFPKRSIAIILDYFKDKEADYTEDMFWLLLYVKGYDFYKDYSSNAVHICYRKVNGKPSGYLRMKKEKPHKPMLAEYFNSYYDSELQCVAIKELRHINQEGKREREKNYKKLHEGEIK